MQTNGPGGGDVLGLAYTEDGTWFALVGGLSIFSPRTLYRSDNQGTSWVALRAPADELYRLDTTPDGKLWVARERNGLFVSTDRGTTWTEVTLPTAFVFSINFADGTPLLGTSNGVFRTEDGGSSWVSAGLTDQWVEAIEVISPDSIYALAHPAQGTRKLFLFDGNAWVPVLPETDTRLQLAFSLAAHPDGYLFIGTQGIAGLAEHPIGVFRLDSEKQISFVGLDEISIGDLLVMQDKKLLAATLGRCNGTTCPAPAGIYLSEDAGTSWKEFGLHTTSINHLASGRDGQLMAGTARLGTDVLFGGERWYGRGLHQRHPADTTWHAVNRNVVHSTPYELAASKTGTLYAAADQEIYKSTDQGQTWAVVFPNTPAPSFPAPPFYQLSTCADDQVFLLVFDGDRQTTLYQSKNQGQTWTRLEVEAAGIQLDPRYPIACANQTLLLGTSQSGLWRSTDAGATWSSIQANLPNSPAIRLTSAAGYTYSGFPEQSSAMLDVFFSNDDGVTWASAFSVDIGTGLLHFEANLDGSLFILTGDALHHMQMHAGQWQQITLPNGPDMQARHITKDALNRWFAATQSEIYTRTPTHSWEKVDSGLPTGDFVIWDLLTSSDGYLYAALDAAGVYRSQLPIHVQVESGARPAPSAFHLSSYPNPAGGPVTFQLELWNTARISLQIYDTLGRPVAALVENQPLAAGIHHYTWDAENAVPGLYAYSLVMEETLETGTFIVTR